jgi:hypothetical protein
VVDVLGVLFFAEGYCCSAPCLHGAQSACCMVLRGQLVGVLHREDEAGAIQGHSRSVSNQGYGGAVISVACSGGY